MIAEKIRVAVSVHIQKSVNTARVQGGFMTTKTKSFSNMVKMDVSLHNGKLMLEGLGYDADYLELISIEDIVKLGVEHQLWRRK